MKTTPQPITNTNEASHSSINLDGDDINHNIHETTERHLDFHSKATVQGIKNAIDNWLYPNDKIYEQAIQKELEALCPNKMGWYKKDFKWETLFIKIENLITLFESFRCAIFDHVFKKKISPTVNSESSKSEITSWKVSEEVQWCFENLDSIIEEDDKTYLQMVAKKVFGRKPTKNQYVVTRAILHNLFNPEIDKIKFDERYLTRKLSSFLHNHGEDDQENNESSSSGDE
ncbi:28912_t:CDS:2 [Dentiscutata erythropus]|uniref:28912_t:CDS:1 n=1 Tax=Dentiscutata erythropus TaxID=1348616 RepID=A0A9N8V9P4_9GLOM|nr:28912_t:CDS:2 [Dentiscutata erythropus]